MYAPCAHTNDTYPKAIVNPRLPCGSHTEVGDEYPPPASTSSYKSLSDPVMAQET